MFTPNDSIGGGSGIPPTPLPQQRGATTPTYQSTAAPFSPAVNPFTPFMQQSTMQQQPTNLRAQLLHQQQTNVIETPQCSTVDYIVQVNGFGSKEADKLREECVNNPYVSVWVHVAKFLPQYVQDPGPVDRFKNVNGVSHYVTPQGYLLNAGSQQDLQHFHIRPLCRTMPAKLLLNYSESFSGGKIKIKNSINRVVGWRYLNVDGQMVDMFSGDDPTDGHIMQFTFMGDTKFVSWDDAGGLEQKLAQADGRKFGIDPTVMAFIRSQLVHDAKDKGVRLLLPTTSVSQLQAQPSTNQPQPLITEPSNNRSQVPSSLSMDCDVLEAEEVPLPPPQQQQVPPSPVPQTQHPRVVIPPSPPVVHHVAQAPPPSPAQTSAEAKEEREFLLAMTKQTALNMESGYKETQELKSTVKSQGENMDKMATSVTELKSTVTSMAGSLQTHGHRLDALSHASKVYGQEINELRSKLSELVIGHATPQKASASSQVSFETLPNNIQLSTLQAFGIAPPPQQTSESSESTKTTSVFASEAPVKPNSASFNIATTKSGASSLPFNASFAAETPSKPTGTPFSTPCHEKPPATASASIGKPPPFSATQQPQQGFTVSFKSPAESTDTEMEDTATDDKPFVPTTLTPRRTSTGMTLTPCKSTSIGINVSRELGNEIKGDMGVDNPSTPRTPRRRTTKPPLPPTPSRRSARLQKSRRI